jgi:Flp pilus assembly protein TadG
MRLGTRSHRQSGQVTLFLAGCSLGLVLLAGLSVDGGRILGAREQAWDEAQEAARAGADALSVADLRGQGETVVDVAAAQQAVANYMATTGDTAVVTVSAQDMVTVTVTSVVQPYLLSIIGINTVPVTGTATAEPQEGTGP